MALKDNTIKEIFIIEFYIRYEGWRSWRDFYLTAEAAEADMKHLFPNHLVGEDIRITKFARNDNV